MSTMALTQVRDQLAEGIRTFLHWWLAELKEMIPPALRRRLLRGRGRIVLDLSGDFPRFWCKGDGWRPVEDGKTEKTAGRARAADIAVDPALVFRKEIALPKMLASQARAALRLQLNRHVPFRAADVVFDCRRKAENAEAGTVTAELGLMRRADVAAVQERLSAYGVTPKRIGLLADRPEPGVLFDFHERSRGARFTRMHGLLTLLAGMLALAALFAIEDRRAAELAAWRATAAEQAKEAAKVRELNNEVAALKVRTAFLKRQWQSVPRVALLESLSATLPDGTWLESVEITGSKIHLTGYSDKASSVPEWLQRTGKVKELRFVSGVSSTAKPGIDRFDVEGVIP